MGITVIVLIYKMYFYPPVFYWCNRSFNINPWVFEFLELVSEFIYARVVKRVLRFIVLIRED